MSKKIKNLSYIIAILISPFMFVYAGIDDSPGGQLLGVFLFIAGIVGIIKNNKKNPLK